ncbi:MAG: PilZ domain-containing protein [Sphingomonadaceae bacterium]|nr:PilZ domain-containing protein [Sphingomonadaceae bacterium]
MFVSLLDRLSASSDVTADRRRAEPRTAVAVAAELEVDGVRHPIEIGNLSASGLMAWGDVEVAVPARVAAWIDGDRFEGEIRWQREHRFGMRFDEPLHLDTSIIERCRPACVETSKVMSRWMV